MVIDVHSHFMRPEHWGSEFQDHWKPAYGWDWPQLTPEGFDEVMHGVDAAIVFGITATAAGVRTPSDEVAAFCKAARTPTVGFMALDPADPDVLDQLDEGVALGLQGIKLYPVLAGWEADGPIAAPMLAEAERRGLVILWHMGASPSPRGRLKLSEPMLLDDVAARYPKLKQIIAHMGHPWQRDTILVLRKHPNVYADVSGQWARTMEGYLALVHAQEWGVTHKLLFGSDYPLWTPDEAMAALRALAQLSPGDLPRVRHETIDQLLAQPALELLELTAS